MTYIVGLTGSIATGKSTVLGFFGELGVPTYSADQAVHELYAGAAVEPVSALFPQAIEHGIIDRQKLAAELIKTPENLPALEAIVHPLVRQKTLAFIQKHQSAKTNIIVLEIPLLFEVKNPYPTDAIAVTWCDDDVQRARALARPQMTTAKFETILARQIPQAAKRAQADFEINTGLSPQQTKKNVAQILKYIEDEILHSGG